MHQRQRRKLFEMTLHFRDYRCSLQVCKLKLRQQYLRLLHHYDSLRLWIYLLGLRKNKGKNKRKNKRKKHCCFLTCHGQHPRQWPQSQIIAWASTHQAQGPQNLYNLFIEHLRCHSLNQGRLGEQAESLSTRMKIRQARPPASSRL